MLIEAYIDGACEPVNPGGTASYGVLVKVGGVTVWESSKVVGMGSGMSNNVAEYAALVALLEWWKPRSKPGVLLHIYTDSKLIFNQLGTGLWSARKGFYIPYYEKALELLTGQVFFKWIPREENQEADRLSKRILKEIGVRITER